MGIESPHGIASYRLPVLKQTDTATCTIMKKYEKRLRSQELVASVSGMTERPTDKNDHVRDVLQRSPPHLIPLVGLRPPGRPLAFLPSYYDEPRSTLQSRLSPSFVFFCRFCERDPTICPPP